MFFLSVPVVHGKKDHQNLEDIRSPHVGNIAIDDVDVQWWDDAETLLLVDVSFNFPVSVTTVIADKATKTHIIQLATIGTVAKSYRRMYAGIEHHAVPKRFRNIIEEIRYEGSKSGKANLVIYLRQPAQLSIYQDNNFRTLHLELSGLVRHEAATPTKP